MYHFDSVEERLLFIITTLDQAIDGNDYAELHTKAKIQWFFLRKALVKVRGYFVESLIIYQTEHDDNEGPYNFRPSREEFLITRRTLHKIGISMVSRDPSIFGGEYNRNTLLESMDYMIKTCTRNIEVIDDEEDQRLYGEEQDAYDQVFDEIVEREKDNGESQER